MLVYQRVNHDPNLHQSSSLDSVVDIESNLFVHIIRELPISVATMVESIGPWQWSDSTHWSSSLVARARPGGVEFLCVVIVVGVGNDDFDENKGDLLYMFGCGTTVMG